MEQIESATVELSKEEKAELFNNMVVMWIVGVLMVAFITFLVFGTGDGSFEVPMPLWIFAFLFYALLAYIIYAHTKNAGRKTKTVITGIITQKITIAPKINRIATTRQTFKICLFDTWFIVQQPIYAKVNIGDKVDLHCLDKNVVLKAEVLSTADEAILQAMKPYLAQKDRKENTLSLLDLMLFTPDDHKIIREKLLYALIYKVGRGILISVTCFFLILLFVLLSFGSADRVVFQVISYSLIVVLVIIFLYLNIPTWKLFRDILYAQKYKVVEEVIDKVFSTNKLTGPHSVEIVNGDHSKFPRNHYLQTASFWLPVSESDYQTPNVGDLVEVTLAKHSKTILGLGF